MGDQTDMGVQAQVRTNPHAGMTMKSMVNSHLGPTSHGTSSYVEPSTLSPAESQRNYAIASRLNQKNFMGNVYKWFTLPNDPENAQTMRRDEYFRQCAMPWGSVFMQTPTDAQRLNNPAQQSFVSQRQLSVPNTYSQFYAFMHAMSAAFGQLKLS